MSCYLITHSDDILLQCQLCKQKQWSEKNNKNSFKKIRNYIILYYLSTIMHYILKDILMTNYDSTTVVKTKTV